MVFFVNKLHKQLMGKTKRHNNIYTNISNLFSYLRLQVALDGIIIDWVSSKINK